MITAEIDRMSQARLNKAIKKLVTFSDETMEDVVKKSAIYFVQSAQKNTPPARGKKAIPAKKYKNPVIQLAENDWERIKNGMKWKVPQKKKVLFFKLRKEATDASKIKYRGAGRAGWFGVLPKLGKSFQPYLKSVNRANIEWVARTFSGLRKEDKKGEYNIIIENRVKAISRFGKIAERIALSAAGKRISREAYQAVKKWENKWRLL